MGNFSCCESCDPQLIHIPPNNQPDFSQEKREAIINLSDCKQFKEEQNSPCDEELQIFYCWVTAGAVINQNQWNIEWNLHMNGYTYTFNADFKEINQVYKIAKKNDKCFPLYSFPKEHPSDIQKREPQLQKTMDLINEYSILRERMPIRSKCNFRCSNTPITAKQIEKLRKILCIILNASSFAIRNDLYQKLNICDEMKQLLQILAKERLAILQQRQSQIIHSTNYKKLYSKLAIKGYEFTRVSLVKTPNFYDKNKHWALKFYGNDHLLTLGWFVNDHTFYEIVDNDIFGQLIHWHSSYDGVPTNKFYKLWEEIHRISFISPIRSGDIGCLIDRWIKENKNNKYQLLGNNCQHFATDFLSVFNVFAAQKLTEQFGSISTAGSVAPLLGISAMEKEIDRIDHISSVLRNELKRTNRRLYFELTFDLKQRLKQIHLKNYYNIFKKEKCESYTEIYTNIIATKNDKYLKEVIGMRLMAHRKRFLVNICSDVKKKDNDFDMSKYLSKNKAIAYYDILQKEGFVKDNAQLVQELTDNDWKEIKSNSHSSATGSGVLLIKDNSQSILKSEPNIIEEQEEKVQSVEQYHKEVQKWLKDTVNLFEYYDTLIQNGYDRMPIIGEMTENDLICIGITKRGHYQRIVRHIEEYKSKNNVV